MLTKNQTEIRALNLLEKALALPPEQQFSFINSNTADDKALKERVLAMWSANNQNIKVPKTGSGLNYAERISRPSRIGSFKIHDELGSGGMGSVYLGQKITEDFEFYAAIKVVRKDSQSDNLISRLKSERRTLANLRHPNIAHFYDGGETEKGHPFFVMEYVKGQKLFDYLRNENIKSEQRLSIFKDICAAVACAHQNLVIHRDLTPANILVSDDGVAKLIDFGIAHTLDEDIPTNSTDQTGTQGYVAPERSSGKPASTITDIYSLGIILTELIENAHFLRKSDLVAIAHKAANTNPEHRYQSVDVLIQDLLRYEAKQAVLAVEQGWFYITKRFVSRHLLLVGAATTVFIISLLASFLISLSYFSVQEAEEHSRNRFNEVRELANFMMFDLYDEVVKLDTSLAAREILIETTLNYLDRLAEQPEAPQDLKVELALGYQRMADIAGGTSAINLGERTKAENLYKDAKKLIDEAYTLNSSDPITIRTYAKIYRAIGTFEWISNLDFEKAGIHFSSAKSALQRLLENKSATLDDHVMNGALALSLSQSARNMSDFESAITWAKNGIDILNELHTRHPAHYESQFNLAHAYIYLGEAITTQVYELGGNIKEAIQPFDHGKSHLEALIAPTNAPTLAKAQYLTALVKRSVAACQLDEQRKDAISDLVKAEILAEELMEGEKQNNFVEERLLKSLESHADCELREGNLKTAFSIAETLIIRRQEKAKNTHNNPLNLARLIDSQWLMANILLSANDLTSACDFLRQGSFNANKFKTISKNPLSIQLNTHIKEIESNLTNCEQVTLQSSY